MNKSNLIPVLKSFSKDEIKEFEKFLDSPFFGCGKFVLKFYKALIKYYPLFNEEDIKKEKVFAIVYKNKKYNDALTRRIISDLLRFSEEYMTYVNFKGNDAFKSQCSLNELRRRKLEDLFRLRSGSLKKKINNSEIIDPLHILQSYFTNLEISQFRSLLPKNKNHEYLRLAVEDLTMFFLKVITIYKGQIHAFSFEIESKDDICRTFLNNFNYNRFTDELDNNKSKYSTYLKIMKYSYDIVISLENFESCKKLFDIVKKNSSILTRNELLNVYRSMANFYNSQNMFNNIDCADNLFKIYKTILDEKLFAYNENLFQMGFCRNYIRVCKIKGEFNEIKTFCKNYYSNFPFNYKQDFIDYSDSVYYFGNKLFEKSLSSASKVNIDIEAFKNDIRILKIKNHYELGYFESVNSEIDNFKHFLSNTKFPIPGTLTVNKNFSNFVLCLNRFKENSKVIDIHILRKEIENENLVNEKKWLLEKIDELIKK